VKARAALPYDNNAHPRILRRVFWSTVFSPMMDTAPYCKIRIMQGRGNDKNITGSLGTTPPNKKTPAPVAARGRRSLRDGVERGDGQALRAAAGVRLTRRDAVKRNAMRRDTVRSINASAKRLAAWADI
jgi:hypothetical protein